VVVKIKKFINWITKRRGSSKSAPNEVQKSGFQIFKEWIQEQNSLNKFASDIRDGTTVYFSDDFAACYDLMIKGFGKSENTIVVQLNLETESELKGGINENFLKIVVDTWIQLNWEVWYLDTNLKWMTIANKNGQKKYDNNDLIKSDRIDFEFKLKEIIE
jgi:hypothetical protein